VTITATPPRLGELLKTWRSKRRMSQLDLASQAGVSPRHLSFVETGRSKPSREMVLHLAEQLDVPLRDRNALLTAAGFAPAYRESSFDAPDLRSARQAIDVMLRNHEPMPALVIDRTWNLVSANRGLGLFLDLIAPELLDGQPNVIRVSLHPDGLARHIANFDEYVAHLIERLRRQLEASGDPALAALLDEVSAYPNIAAALGAAEPLPPPGVVLPVQLHLPDGTDLSFFSTMTVFGAPLDVTLAELAIESFFPADGATEAYVHSVVTDASELRAAPAARPLSRSV
jgi:transcriptional regulator with XRE-family HTH domain